MMKNGLIECKCDEGNLQRELQSLQTLNTTECATTMTHNVQHFFSMRRLELIMRSDEVCQVQQSHLFVTLSSSQISSRERRLDNSVGCLNP